MEFGVTLALAAALATAAIFAGWRGARPADPMKGPRLAPWRLIMVTCAAFALLMLVHLMNLLGVTTGRPA